MSETGDEKIDRAGADVARLQQWQQDHERLCAERQDTIQRSLDQNGIEHREIKLAIHSVGARVWGLVLTTGAAIIAAVLNFALTK